MVFAVVGRGEAASQEQSLSRIDASSTVIALASRVARACHRAVAMASATEAGLHSSGPRPSIKSSSRRQSDQERRRSAVLTRQKEARRNLTNHARSIAAQAPVTQQSDDEAMSIADGSDSSKATKQSREAKLIQRREYWSKQLASPEWMVDVPNDLNGIDSAVGAGILCRYIVVAL
jgi:Snurportin1